LEWVLARLCRLQKGCTRLAAASDKVYQLLAHGRWFSPASSITKCGRHDIAEMLLKVALSTINQIIDICEQHRLSIYDANYFSANYFSIGLLILQNAKMTDIISL